MTGFPGALLDRAQLKQGLIVSVQAPEGSPMRHPDVIAAMAEASLRNGALGVRLESPEHIGAVRERCPDALIIGLWKRTWAGSSVYITCLLYTSPSPRDKRQSRMPSSA